MVESIVASALFLTVLLPAVFFLGRMIVNQHSRDLLIATQLAQTEMETTIAHTFYFDEDKPIKSNNKHWRIVRHIQDTSGLIEISIKVYRGNKREPTVEIKTLRFNST